MTSELELVSDIYGTRLMWGGHVVATEPHKIRQTMFAWQHFQLGHHYTLNEDGSMFCDCGESLPAVGEPK